MPPPGLTVTVTLCCAVPPVPLQLSVKSVVLESALVVVFPDVGLLPLQPPEALHDVAFVEDHVRVEVPSTFTAVGLALRLTVGGGVVEFTVTVTLR